MSRRIAYWKIWTLFLLLSVLLRSASADVLRVGIEDIDYYPHIAYGYHNDSYAQLVLERFFKEQGHEVVFVPLSVKRFNDSFLTKEVDFKYPDNAVWRTEEKHGIAITYSDPLITSVSGVIRTKENLGKPATSIKQVATLIGFFPQRWHKEIKAGEVELLEESNPRTVVQLTVNGLVDAIGLDYSVVNHYLGQVGQKGRLLMDPSLPYSRNGLSLSTIERTDVIEALNQFLHENKAYLEQLKKEKGIIHDPIAYTQSQLQN